MKKTVLIIPSIREVYKNQIEFSVDLKLIKFLKNILRDYQIKIAYEKTKQSFDLLVISGGNSIVPFSNKKSDKIRSLLDIYYFDFATKNKKKILGICHGASFIANKFKSEIIRTKKHVGKHFIKDAKHKIKVNSFHNLKIKNLNKNLKIKYLADDNSIESFQDKNGSMLGIMWHPERYNLIKKFDIKIINNFLRL